MGFKKAYVSKYSNVKEENYKDLEVIKMSTISEVLAKFLNYKNLDNKKTLVT